MTYAAAYVDRRDDCDERAWRFCKAAPRCTLVTLHRMCETGMMVDAVEHFFWGMINGLRDRAGWAKEYVSTQAQIISKIMVL